MQVSGTSMLTIGSVVLLAGVTTVLECSLALANEAGSRMDRSSAEEAVDGRRGAFPDPDPDLTGSERRGMAGRGYATGVEARDRERSFKERLETAVVSWSVSRWWASGRRSMRRETRAGGRQEGRMAVDGEQGVVEDGQ